MAPKKRLTQVKAYFGFTSSTNDNYLTLRKEIKNLLQTRKISSISEAGAQAWNELLDTIQNFEIFKGPPLREKFRDERMRLDIICLSSYKM